MASNVINLFGYKLKQHLKKVTAHGKLVSAGYATPESHLALVMAGPESYIAPGPERDRRDERKRKHRARLNEFLAHRAQCEDR